MSLNMEENDNNNPTKKESNHGKTDLLDNFVLLKTYVSLLENMIQTPKHNWLQSDKSSRQLYNSKGATFHDKPDVNMDLFHDFYELAGIRCVKLERISNFVFEMCKNETNTEDNYMVEILIDDHGHALLGDSKLPQTVCVEEILSIYPIDDVSNVKHFLNFCKHYVETYICRKKQLTDLKNLLSEIADAGVEHNSEFIFITIKIPGIKDINTGQIYNVVLDLYYKPDEIRPYKLYLACKKPSSSCFFKRLNEFFKPFLTENLCSALLQISILNTETNLFWQKIMINDDNMESYEIESSLENFGGILKPCLYRKAME